MPGEKIVQTDSQKPIIVPQNDQNEKNQASGGINKLMVGAVGMSFFGGALPAGHAMAVINNSQEVMRNWVNSTVLQEYGIEMTSSSDTVLWSVVVSLFVVGAIIGSLCAASLADSIGRRRALLLTNGISLLSAVLFLLCDSFNIIELLLIGRVLTGIATGLATGIVPLYLSEICDPSLKGVMGVVLPSGLTIGLMLAQIFGTSSLLGTADLWPTLMGGHILYGVISLIFYPFCPRSPSHLALIKHDFVAAEHELLRLRGYNQTAVDLGISNLKEHASHTKQDGWSIVKLFKTKSLRKALVCVSVLNAGQQLVGINVVFYYSTFVFKNAGLGLYESQLASLGCAIINCVMAILALITIRFFRRKLLLLVSVMIYMVSQIALLLSLRYLALSTVIPVIAMISINVSVLGYGIGLGPVPYMIGTEMFPDGPRSLGLSLGAFSNYFCNLMIGLFFPIIQTYLDELSFIIFIVISALFAVFVVVYVPETKETKGVIKRTEESEKLFPESIFLNDKQTKEFRGST